MNLAYKSLQQKLTIGSFTVLQWMGIVTGVFLALLWGSELSPFGPQLTIVTSVYIAGIPALAAFMASITEFDLWRLLRAMARHHRTVGRYMPGPGDSARGYVLSPDPREQQRHAAADEADLDLSALWEQ